MLHKLSDSIVGRSFFALLGILLFVYLCYSLEDSFSPVESVYGILPIYVLSVFPFWLTYALGVLLLCLNGWLIIRINDKNRFVEGSSASMWFYYIIFISFFPELILELELLVGSSLCLYMLNVALGIYNQANVMWPIFATTVLLGLASILFYPFFLLAIVILTTISIFRSFNLREYIIAIIGFLLPFFYLYSGAYILSYNTLSPDWSAFSINEHLPSYSWGGIMLALLSIIAAAHTLLYRSKLVVRQRNQLLVVLLFTVIVFIIAFFVSQKGSLLLLAAPLSLCFKTLYQNFSKKWILDVYLLGLLLSSILEKLSP